MEIDVTFDMESFCDYIESEIEALEERNDDKSKAMVRVYRHILVLIDWGVFEIGGE